MTPPRVKSIHAPLIGALLGVGILSISAPAAPTGHGAIDVCWRLALGVGVALAGMAVPAPVLVAITAGVGALAMNRPIVGLAALAVAATIAVASARRFLPQPLGVLGAGVASAGTMYLPSLGGFGRSALLGMGVIAVLCAIGYRHHAAAPRRTMRRAALCLSALVGVCAIGSVTSWLLARSHTRAGEQALFDTTRAANQGELAEASVALDRAQASIRDVRSSLMTPWARLGDLLPVFSQHRALGVELVRAADTTIDAASAALAATDLDRLKVESSRINVQRVGAMEAPLAVLASAVEDLRTHFSTPRSRWILPGVRSRLTDLAADLDTQAQRARHAATAARLAPSMLGGTGPRRILIAFLTPSEARPLGGHMANFGELTIDDGKITLSDFGRSSDLVEASSDPQRRIISGPASYLARYGPFGAGGAGTPAGPDWWLNITISPDFPSVAQVMSEMYEKATGRPVDEVMSIDPTGLAELLDITGPIDAPGIDGQITTDNVVELLTKTQYQKFTKDEKDDRVEFLGDAGRATFDALLNRKRLDPIVLVKHLATPAASGRLMLWSRHEAEQSLFTDIGIAGAFTRPMKADALALTNLNAGANKTDAFLQRSVTYKAVLDEATGRITGTIDVALRNDSPKTGLPFRVIGNMVDEPFGTNRTYLTLYGSSVVSRMTVDERDVTPSIGTELDWTYAERRISLAPGSTTNVHYDIAGQLLPGTPYKLYWRTQPMVNPDELDVQVYSTDGRLLAGYQGPALSSLVISRPGMTAPAPRESLDTTVTSAN